MQFHQRVRGATLQSVRWRRLAKSEPTLMCWRRVQELGCRQTPSKLGWWGCRQGQRSTACKRSLALSTAKFSADKSALTCWGEVAIDRINNTAWHSTQVSLEFHNHISLISSILRSLKHPFQRSKHWERQVTDIFKLDSVGLQCAPASKVRPLFFSRIAGMKS